MEILQLRYFYESAKAESLSAAARKFMVPVSSVSVSIKRLESELGVALFERTGNRIFLTERGKLFFKTAEQTLMGLDGGIQAVTAPQTNEVRLKLLVHANRKMVMRRILKFREQYPTVYFSVDLIATKPLSEYDIIITSPNEELDEYDHFEFSRYQIRVEALATDPLAHRKITLDQLRDRSFVTLCSKQDGAFQIFRQACIRRNFTPKVILECNDYSCHNLCLLSGTALSVTLGGKQESSSLSETTYLDIVDFDEQSIKNFYYKKSAYHGATKLFVDFIKSY